MQKTLQDRSTPDIVSGEMKSNDKGNLVLIAGGGPAGMATALSLSKRGISCMVVEPGLAVDKIGETVPPNAKPLLMRLGISHLFEAPAHLQCYGNSFIWGDSDMFETSFFKQTYKHGWHINRCFFEEQLKQHVSSTGIEWLHGYKVIHCKKMEKGWEVTLQKEGEETRKQLCGFLVDATGRSCRIARLIGQQRNRIDTLIGVSAMITTVQNIQHHTFIEATTGGWWYAAPLPDKKLSLAFMTDADLMDKQMLYTDYLLKNAETTTLIGSLLKGSIVEENTRTTVNSSATSFLRQRFGQDWLAVGDAAYAFDPLSSYGIVSALEGGYYAGHAIADTLSEEHESLNAYDTIISQAFTIYLDMYKQQYRSEQRWKESVFWKRRR